MEIILCYSDVSVYILQLMPSGQITPSITFYNVYKLSLMASRQMTPNITFNKSKKPHSRFRNWLYFTLLPVYLFSLDSTYTPDTHSAIHKKLIRLFRIIFIPSNFFYFRPPDHVISMERLALNFRCQCTQQKLQSICAVLTFDPQLKKILTFSVYKGNNKITELRTIFQRESQNS